MEFFFFGVVELNPLNRNVFVDASELLNWISYSLFQIFLKILIESNEVWCNQSTTVIIFVYYKRIKLSVKRSGEWKLVSFILVHNLFILKRLSLISVKLRIILVSKLRMRKSTLMNQPNCWIPHFFNDRFIHKRLIEVFW